MIYLLVRNNLDWLEAHDVGFLRVFTFVTFQALASILLSFALCIALGPWVIGVLRRKKLADLALFDQAQAEEIMKGKRGTPTMGGVLIVGSIFLTTVLLADLGNFYVRISLIWLLLLCAIGFSDDYLKLTVGKRQGGRQGLTGREKLTFQLALGAVVAYFTFQYASELPHKFYFPFFKNWAVPINLLGFVIISTIVTTGSSNAVNLTDGLDGLASGCMAIVGFAFCALSLIVGTAGWARMLYIPYVQATDQMAVLAGCITGACLGFLWFNCNPARVFMGDTGSLALGGLIGYIAVVIRHEITLFLVGGVFVAETLSVMAQVLYFKYSRRRYGEPRRILKMSPLHNHFLLSGWSEPQIVVRFWLISAILATMALATVKLR